LKTTKRFVVSLLVLILSQLAQAQAPKMAPNATPPNIIYIMADDLGYGDLGCYGQKRIPTPNLDRMAAQGTRFTDFYSGSTVCAPSRYALMSGRHMGHAYIRGNGEFPVRSDEQLLPKLMKKAGYTTAMFGKWGLGQSTNSGSPEKQGWDHFLGYTHHVHAHRFQTPHLWTIQQGQCVKMPIDTNQHTHQLLTESTFDFIKQSRQKPFFIYWAMTMPHAEMYAPKQTLKKYLNPDGSSIFAENNPFNGRQGGAEYPSYRPQNQANANTAAMIEHLDGDIGRLMQLLKELGLDKNTYIFFTSDNGPHEEGGRIVEFFDSNGQLRGYKRDLYEGGIRVPMIAWGGGVAKGKTTAEPLANWDVMPTILELTNQPKLADIDGLSFANVLKNKPIAKKHDYLYWEFFERGFDQALRMGKWKAVRQKSKGGQTELYDLSKDLSETTDVAAQNPDVVTQADAFFRTVRVESELFKAKP
jgi:arylsulfatase A-like enzyme